MAAINFRSAWAVETAVEQLAVALHPIQAPSRTGTARCAPSSASTATCTPLCHYSATELLTAGVDLRTVAGRLGHGGGGANHE